MRKYQVAIILLRDRLHFIYQLQSLFSAYMEFSSYSLEAGIKPYINCDLALVPSQEVGERIRKYLLPHTPVIIVRRTVSREAWERIVMIPSRAEVLVVNTYWQMAIQTISVLYELGLRNVKLIPFDNTKSDSYAHIRYAITVNERDYVPKHIANIIEIGPRLVNVSSLFDILTTLNLVATETLAILRGHERDMMPLNPGFVEMLNQFHETHASVSGTLDMLDDAALIFDADYHVHIYNKKMTEVFPPSEHQLINLPLVNLFPERLLPMLMDRSPIRDELIHIKGKDYLLSKSLVFHDENLQEGMLLLRARESIESQSGRMAYALRHAGSHTKYSFRDIQGGNANLHRILRLAERAAKSSSDILIEGESGTGKELFVQSIHNASPRADAPFIAFNCAALSGSLMESELFGYEEGSFTGASRKGKHGLFEAASGGTIFLDEISEIPMDMQAKLLRVLQEREIIRVGSVRPIPIDIRIIAATNMDLYELVRQKKFRLDLYFRLNVFNIKIPALRERADDIPELVAFFLKQHGIHTDFPQETMHIFQCYDWLGNIRELKNCMEYMVNIGEGFLPQNLPEHIRLRTDAQIKEPRPATAPADFRNETDPMAVPACDATDMLLLKLLYEASNNHQHIGRKRLAEAVSERQGYLSEQSARHRLERLSRLGYVTFARGRGGTMLTLQGLACLREDMH